LRRRIADSGRASTETAGRVTIKSVAKRAGVSIGTVSRVINGFRDVNPELQERVERAVRELDYRPNIRAQSFVRDKSPIISFLLSNRGGLNPFHSLILQGVEEYCADAGYFVLFARCQYSSNIRPSDLRLPSVLLTNGLADCVIAAGVNHENLLKMMEGRGLSYVVLANNLVSEKAREPFNQVRFDDFGGFYEAVRYLIQLGHKDIWFVGDTSLQWFRTRHEAYLKSMREHGLEPRAQTVALSDDLFENGRASVEMILESEQPLSAVICGAGESAEGAIEALREHGREVPRDASVIGFDHMVVRSGLWKLTSVSVDAVEVGRQLARLAVERLKSNGQAVPESVIPTTLIKRGTCRPFRPNEQMVL
jgi:DNA-binding LacI/PurR family transcriptional regulator